MRPIAIIGIGCRVPGAHGPEAFWRLLVNGQEAIRPVPADRWDTAALLDADPDAPGAVGRVGGFLDDVREFDAAFFNVSAPEAAHMDPQQRLLAETAWEAFEDAGLPMTALEGSKTAVVIGIGPGDYGRLCAEHPSGIDAFVNTGNFLSIAANRLSYIFDLRGPSLAIDTACSSSLVAVHMGCRSIECGEATMALAGGVNMMLGPAISLGFTRAGMLSRAGHCRAFARDADGYVRSEGAGLIVLKPLDRALSDGDRVYAVIHGSAVNQSGRRNGLTAPGRWGEEAVMRDAWVASGYAPAQADYVEAQGTGTLLGDAMEATAIANVFGTGRDVSSRCRIGSVKTNIGHLETAAGVASLIKTALMLRHGLFVPSLHYSAPNPHATPESLGLLVQTRVESWPVRSGRHRLAGVSAFGFGGTNAHVCLSGLSGLRASDQRAVAGATETSEIEEYLLPVSAQHPAALRELVRGVAVCVERAADPVAICRAMARRRTHHDYRVAFSGRSGMVLARQMRTWLDDDRADVGRMRFRCTLIARVDVEGAGTRVLQRLGAWGIRPQAIAAAHDSYTPSSADVVIDFTAAGAAANAIDGRAPLAAIAADLYRRGFPLAWDAIYPGVVTQVDLPRYPWQRQAHWCD